jgi:hypothetical protein
MFITLKWRMIWYGSIRQKVPFVGKFIGAPNSFDLGSGKC